MIRLKSVLCRNIFKYKDDLLDCYHYLGRVEGGAAGFAALMAVSAADCDRSLCRMVTLAPLPGEVLSEAAPSGVMLE